MIFNLRTKEVLGVIESDSTKLEGSYDSVLKINKIGGVCEQGENPSPSNKQEVKNSVVSGIKTHRKNLLNIRKGYSGTQYGVTCTVDNDGVITLNGTASDLTIFDTYDTLTSKAGKCYKLEVMYISGSTSKKVSIVNQDGSNGWMGYNADITNSNVVHFQAFDVDLNMAGGRGIYVQKDTVVNNLKFKLMFIQTDVDGFDSVYEPFVESVITLSKPIELYSIGDVQDTIENGKVKRRIGKVKLSGEWAWNKHASIGGIPNANGYYSHQSIGQPNMLDGENGIFTHFQNGYLTHANYKAFVGSDAIQLRFDEINSASELKAWLNANEVYAYYLLAEPTTEVLPSRDQMILSTLQTFTGVTYVEFDSEVEPTLNSDYATSPVGAVALSIYAYDEIIKHYVKYNDDGSVRFNGSVNVDEWVIANNLQALQMVFADSIQTYKGITASTDVTAQNNVVAQNELRGKDLHFTNMGVNGGTAQPVEWVWDAALGRYVLCTITG